MEQTAVSPILNPPGFDVNVSSARCAHSHFAQLNVDLHN
jgi:hypothetical protein